MTYPQQPGYPQYQQPQPAYPQYQQPSYPQPAPTPAPAPAPGYPAMPQFVAPPAPAPQPPAPAPAPAPPAPAPAPAPQPPAPAPAPPAPAPQPPAPAPAPQTPPAPADGSTGQQPAQPPATGGDPGFPANTPWRDMKPEEQIAYWQHQSRKHEERVRGMSDYDQLKTQAEQYQQLVASQQTEHQRAVADALRQGREQALAETGSQLVDQWVRAAAVGRLPQESVNALLQGLDRRAFLNAQTGAVDTDKVWQFVSSVAPQPPAAVPVPGAAAIPGHQPQPYAPQLTQQVAQPFAVPTGAPDFGQGQPTAPRSGGLAAGREIARQRFGVKTTPPTPPAQ